MKILRLLPLMMALVIPSLALTSCDDDDDSDMPDVTISLSYGEGAVAVDHQVYVVKGNDLTVTGVYVRANRPGKTATLGPVTYSFNGVVVGYNPVAPFGITLPTASLEPGQYVLTLSMTVAEVHCELAQGMASVPVNVVDSESDIPSNPDNDGGNTHEVKISLQQ